MEERAPHKPSPEGTTTPYIQATLAQSFPGSTKIVCTPLGFDPSSAIVVDQWQNLLEHDVCIVRKNGYQGHERWAPDSGALDVINDPFCQHWLASDAFNRTLKPFVNGIHTTQTGLSPTRLRTCSALSMVILKPIHISVTG